uniref:Uncharacterized protein n=1 Tax=Arundo donax TaxID=35708 RepID=A0A0A9HCS2_ARUDO
MNHCFSMTLTSVNSAQNLNLLSLHQDLLVDNTESPRDHKTSSPQKFDNSVVGINCVLLATIFS